MTWRGISAKLPAMNQWSRKDAETHIKDVFDAARHAPQAVTDGDETAAVVVSGEEYARLTGKSEPPKTVHWNGREMTLVELLLAMPHKEGFEIERTEMTPRDVEF
jgi:hypothetical protein